MTTSTEGSNEDTSVPATIGERIAWARAQKGISAAQLAKMVGRTRAAISLYETGRNNPPTAMLTAMADALDVDVGWLTHGRRLVRPQLPEHIEGWVGPVWELRPFYRSLSSADPKFFSDFAKAVALSVSAPHFGLEAGDILLLVGCENPIASDGSLYALQSSAGTIVVRSEPQIGWSSAHANPPAELVLTTGHGQSLFTQGEALDAQGRVAGWIHRVKPAV